MLLLLFLLEPKWTSVNIQIQKGFCIPNSINAPLHSRAFIYKVSTNSTDNIRSIFDYVTIKCCGIVNQSSLRRHLSVMRATKSCEGTHGDNAKNYKTDLHRVGYTFLFDTSCNLRGPLYRRHSKGFVFSFLFA